MLDQVMILARQHLFEIGYLWSSHFTIGSTEVFLFLLCYAADNNEKLRLKVRAQLSPISNPCYF